MTQNQQSQASLANYPNQSKHRSQSRLRICTQDKIYWLHHDEIHYLKSDSNYTYIYYKGGKILSAKTMKRYADLIMDNEHFIRPHQSYIVNIQFIKSIDKRNKSITLSDNTSIPISRINRKLLMNLFIDA